MKSRIYEKYNIKCCVESSELNESDFPVVQDLVGQIYSLE